MFRAIPSLNKYVKKRQEERNRLVHLQHLKTIKPNNNSISDDFNSQPVLNHKKKQKLLQNKFHQIERQNLILLDKITGIMASRKNRTRSTLTNYITTPPKSLNEVYRKKKYQEIQIQNVKILRRLQQKKTEYPVQKMKKHWQKLRTVVKNISLYPLPHQQIKRDKSDTIFNPSSFRQIKPVYISKYKKINGYDLFIIVKLDGRFLQIKAFETEKDRVQKMIELQRDEAIYFINNECEGNVENIFQKLRFDGTTLHLISESKSKTHRRLLKKIEEKISKSKFKLSEEQNIIQKNYEKQKLDGKQQIIAQIGNQGGTEELDKNIVINQTIT